MNEAGDRRRCTSGKFSPQFITSKMADVEHDQEHDGERSRVTKSHQFAPVPPHPFAPLVPQGHWYQQQLYQPQHDYQDTPQ